MHLTKFSKELFLPLQPRNFLEKFPRKKRPKAWDSANEYVFSVLRLTTTGAARSVLLNFERKNGQPSDGRQAWLALKNMYQNTYRQRSRAMLRRLDDSVMSSDIDPDAFLSRVSQLRDEFGDLGEIVSNERLAIAILDAVSEEMYSTVKTQSIRDPDLRLEEVIRMTKTIFMYHPERSSVPKKSQDSYRKSRDISCREPIMNGRVSAMVTIITCHSCKSRAVKR